MEQEQPQFHRNFESLLRQQLFIYAQELGERFQRERDLVEALARTEERINKLAAASISAQELERQWIAYEVHDRIAQTLASVYQQLQILESLTGENSAARKTTVKASALLKEAITEARNIMNDLHPPVLDDFGSIPIIQEEVRRFQDETGVQTRLDIDCGKRPSRDIEMVLYRIFHEALINVKRHASRATQVTVTIKCADHDISLQVEDNGPGFDAMAATRSKQVGGLMSMRRRAEIVGGVCEVVSSLGKGTVVVFRVSGKSNLYRGELGAMSGEKLRRL